VPGGRRHSLDGGVDSCGRRADADAGSEKFFTTGDGPEHPPVMAGRLLIPHPFTINACVIIDADR